MFFFFSSHTDFFHTVYLATQDQIWNLVLFGEKSSLILVSSPHIFTNVLEKNKIKKYLSLPHRHHKVAGSAESRTVYVDAVRRRGSPGALWVRAARRMLNAEASARPEALSLLSSQRLS